VNGQILSCTADVITCVSRLSKTCLVCGAENRDIANYCLKCGRSVTAVPPQERTTVETTAPAEANVCQFHPQVMAQVFCSDCGMPICLTCARPGVQAVYCPPCQAHRATLSRFPQPQFMQPSWTPYPILIRRPGHFP